MIGAECVALPLMLIAAASTEPLARIPWERTIGLMECGAALLMTPNPVFLEFLDLNVQSPDFCLSVHQITGDGSGHGHARLDDGRAFSQDVVHPAASRTIIAHSHFST